MAKANNILCNKIQCIHCKDIIESTHRHDYVTCSCGRVSADGGKDYLKRTYKEDGDYIDMSEGTGIDFEDGDSDNG